MGKAIAMAEKARSSYGTRRPFSPERPNTSVGMSRHMSAAGKAVIFAEGTKMTDGRKSPKSASPQSGRKISMATARKAAMFGQRPSSRTGMSDSETEASDQGLPSLNAGRRVMAFVGSAKQRRQDRSPSPRERSQSPKSRGMQSAGRAMMLAGKGRGGSAQEKEAATELSSEEGLTNKQKIKLAQKAMAFSAEKGGQKGTTETPRPRSPWLNKVQGNTSKGQAAAAFLKKPSKSEEEDSAAEDTQPSDKEDSGRKSPAGSMKKMSLMGKAKKVGKESLDSKFMEKIKKGADTDEEDSGKKSPAGSMKKISLIGKAKKVGKESLDSAFMEKIKKGTEIEEDNQSPEVKQTEDKKNVFKQGLLTSAKQKSFMDKIKKAAENQEDNEDSEIKQTEDKKNAFKQGLLTSAKQRSFMDKIKKAAQEEEEKEDETAEKDEKENGASASEDEDGKKGKISLSSSMKKMSLMERMKGGQKEQQVAEPTDKKEADTDKGKSTLFSSTKKMSFMAKMKGGGEKEQQESETSDKEDKKSPKDGGEKANLTTAAKKLSLMEKLKSGGKESEEDSDPAVTTAENSNQSDSSEVKQEEEAKNLARRESTITITSVNMSNKDEEAPKKKGMFGSMKKFFGSKSKPKKEEIPIETIKEPEKPKEPEVPPPDGKPLTVNIRGTDLDVYIPDRYWWKPVNHKYPEHKLSLDWVYGYRGNDCRNNLFPLASGEVVYFTGTVAVIYDHSQCRQRHYMEHTGEIRSIAVHPDKVTVATGQNEVQYDSYSQAHIRIWDSRTLQTQKVLGTGTMEKAVIALTFSGTLDRLAAIDSSEGHMMSVWDIKSGKKLTEAKVDTEVVCQVGFSPRSPDTIVTAGKEHLVWWELGVETGTLQEVARANYDQRYNKAKYIICFLHNERGDLITGDSNGTVFVWGEGGNNITQALKHIHEGPVFSLLMMKNFLLTAGRDGMVYAFPWGKNMEHAGFSASLQVPRIEGGIRMQCTTADGAVLLLGTTVNSILSVALTSAGCPLQGASLDKDVVTQGHFDDVKAICPQPSHAAPGQFVTAGNDGTVCMHDSESHSLQWKYVIKGATIQCADYYHPGSLPRVALGTKDGSVIVLEVNDLDEVAEMCRASKIARGRITVIKICPDGDRIAIGCQDGSVQILQLTDYCSKLELLGKCKGHKGAITGLDWSADLPTGGYIIQTSSSTYQHFLWDVDQCVQLTDMAGLRNTEWLTYNCMLGYVVKDVWNAGLDGRDVRTLDRAPNWRHVGTADERGEIHMFTYPCAHKDAQADTYKCHSSQVSCLRFLHDNVHLVTAGGKDTSILLWKIISQ
ncbi:EML2 [Branchiostoma lanceolatum]|uniref:EML2 protein n=1 Tax=Branchiostoma lanceolatum TaxID=7740 RepID=A0A8J9ZBP2_BRALA|nr:EML2 [Branchiostoma lanceolatum]